MHLTATMSDRRFSTILTKPALRPKTKLDISDAESTIELAIALTTSQEETSQLKRMFRKLFATSVTGTSGKKEKPIKAKKKLMPDEMGHLLMGEFFGDSPKAPKIPKNKIEKLKKENLKRTKRAVIILSPTPTQLPSFLSRDIFSKGAKGGNHRGRDSAFSSISSLESLQPIAAPALGPSTSSIKLSIREYERLRSLTRRVKRGLMKQEYLTGHLSINLVELLLRKEKQITQARYVRVSKREHREAMLGAIFMGRERAGRVFGRKALLLQHSQGVLAQLREMLELNVSPVGGGLVKMNISPETIHDFVAALQSDVSLQRKEDDKLISVVQNGCAEKNFSAGVNDQITSKRFVQFVQERVEVISTCYKRIDTLVEDIDAIQKHLGALGIIV